MLVLVLFDSVPPAAVCTTPNAIVSRGANGNTALRTTIKGPIAAQVLVLTADVEASLCRSALAHTSADAPVSYVITFRVPGLGRIR